MSDAPAKTRLVVRPRGPLVVEGDFELIDGEGNRIDCGGRTKVSICRCGASASKPLCDGSHNRIGFEPPAEP